MIGPEGAAKAIAAYLTDTTPSIVVRLADELGPPVEPDPEAPAPVIPLDAMPRLFPSTQIGVETVGLDDWPFVITLAETLRSMRRTDLLPDGRIVYECVYPMRVIVWARGDGYHSTSRIRDRLVLAVRESLLLGQDLGGDVRFAVDETSWTERYSDVDRAANLELAQTVAAAACDFEIKIAETLSPLAPATPPATEFDLDTRRLPPHPAL